MHSEDRDEIFNRLQKICKGAEIQHDCKVEFIYVSGYHSVVNHESLAPQVERVISKVATLKHGTLGLGGEDFYNFCGIKLYSTIKRQDHQLSL
jgi:metal-dependent amidase/aminoacylase/carboxypeptidase family protein